MRAGATIVDEARELLGCGGAVLLTAPPGGHTLRLEAVSPTVQDAPRPGEAWDLGPETRRLLERAFAGSDEFGAADGPRQPWAALRARLSGLPLDCWACAPVRGPSPPGQEEPLSLLAVGSRGRRPCEHMERLDALASSAATALSRARQPMGSAAARPGDPGDCLELMQGERAWMVGTLALGVSHTLGNIFGTMLGSLHFLKEEMRASGQAKMLDRLEESASAGIELMRALQAFSSAPHSAGMGPLDLSELAGEVVDLARGLCGPWPSFRDVELRGELRDDCRVWGHEGQLRESVVNMVFNAMQAVGPRGTIVVRTRTEGDWSEVSVCDDGLGMSDEVARRAAEPFFTTRPEGARGLGLTVARWVAVGHRGCLTLRRPEGGGTVVAVRIPRDPHPDQQLERSVNEALATVA